MDLKKELTKGSSSLLVLSVLEKGNMYGYQIIKEIEIQSEFVFSFKEGTLYPILHNFEKEGLVKSYWETADSGRKRRGIPHRIRKESVYFRRFGSFRSVRRYV